MSMLNNRAFTTIKEISSSFEFLYIILNRLLTQQLIENMTSAASLSAPKNKSAKNVLFPRDCYTDYLF